MAKESFKVLRPHQGDKWYDVGDTREVDPASVRHLIGKTLEAGGGSKKADEPANKKADEPANKKMPGMK